jgi:hypothetical protein
MTPRKFNNSLLFFRSISLFSSFFLAVGKEVAEWWEIIREDVGCAGATTPALQPRGVSTEAAKQLGSVGAVKRCSKNDLMCHLIPHMTRPLHHGIWQLYLKCIPQLPWGLPKLRV